tara:strand:- start:1788 stop:2744 length:957 start_codon:yes stop_codon:yes gene_type:complete
MNGNDFNAYYFSHARTALKYGLISLNIREGAEIFIPDYICDVVLHPVEQLKLKPIFYPTLEDLTPEWDFLKNEISLKTAAIIMVNFFGQPQEIERFTSMTKEKNIYLIEDNAHGYGGYYNKKLLGTYGDIGISSPRKFMDTASGGILYTKKDLDLGNYNFEQLKIKKRSKVRDLINKFPEFKREVSKLLNSRPAYEKQETFEEEPIGDYYIDKNSLDTILNKDIQSFSEMRREKYFFWEKFCKERGFKPVFKSIHPEANPWCFPAYVPSQKEAIELFDWGWENGVTIFSWPTLPVQMRKSPSRVLERWKKMVCFSTSF